MRRLVIVVALLLAVFSFMNAWSSMSPKEKATESTLQVQG